MPQGNETASNFPPWPNIWTDVETVLCPDSASKHLRKSLCLSRGFLVPAASNLGRATGRGSARAAPARALQPLERGPRWCWGRKGVCLQGIRGGTATAGGATARGERLAGGLRASVLRALRCDLIQENVSVRAFPGVAGTVRALVTEAKPHGLWLSGQLMGVLFKESPGCSRGGGKRRLSGPGRSRMEPFVARRNRQHPTLRGIQPQRLTSGEFKKKNNTESPAQF